MDVIFQLFYLFACHENRKGQECDTCNSLTECAHFKTSNSNSYYRRQLESATTVQMFFCFVLFCPVVCFIIKVVLTDPRITIII